MTLSVGPKVSIFIMTLYNDTLFLKSQRHEKIQISHHVKTGIFLQYQMITLCLNDDRLPCFGLIYKGQYGYIYFCQ